MAEEKKNPKDKERDVRKGTNVGPADPPSTANPRPPAEGEKDPPEDKTNVPKNPEK